MHKSDIDTPALILDLDLVEDNIARMGAYFRGRPQKLRPHFKTPKTPEIARRQLAAGAIGITAAKLGEAEVLARAGLGPILIANQIAGVAKVDRLFVIAARVDTIATVESEFNIHELERGCARAGRAIDGNHRGRYRNAPLWHRLARGDGRVGKENRTRSAQLSRRHGL